MSTLNTNSNFFFIHLAHTHHPKMESIALFILTLSGTSIAPASNGTNLNIEKLSKSVAI